MLNYPCPNLNVCCFVFLNVVRRNKKSGLDTLHSIALYQLEERYPQTACQRSVPALSVIKQGIYFRKKFPRPLFWPG